MPEKRVTVWVQQFKDRKNLMLQWIDPETGKRQTRTARTADSAEAEDARADLEYELNHGKYQEASRMTWERFRELFEEEYVAGLRPRTGQIYDWVFGLFEELCHPTKLRNITERTLGAFVAALRKHPYRGRDGKMPSTIKLTLQYLHAALAWAAQQKMIPECPAFPSVKVPRKRPQPIPAESFEKLLEKAQDVNMRAYLLCGWLAGLRLSEALALEWEETDQSPWLDFGRDRIILPAGFVKSVEDQWLPLDPMLRKALEPLPRSDKKVFHFVSPGGKPVKKNAIGNRIVAMAKKAGVRMTMHSLRKGFGCRYAGRVPAQVLQRLMRHGDIKTTMAYYANIDLAVEEAVLGPQCNGLRNTEKKTASNGERPNDVTDLQERTTGEP
jgi:integrase